jgi:hypothetical protein
MARVAQVYQEHGGVKYQIIPPCWVPIMVGHTEEAGKLPENRQGMPPSVTFTRYPLNNYLSSNVSS